MVAAMDGRPPKRNVRHKVIGRWNGVVSAVAKVKVPGNAKAEDNVRVAASAKAEVGKAATDKLISAKAKVVNKDKAAGKAKAAASVRVAEAIHFCEHSIPIAMESLIKPRFRIRQPLY